MTTPGVSINDVMIAVRRDVLKATDGRQEPWDQSSLREHFRFCELPETNAPTVAAQPPAPLAGFSDEMLIERAALEHWDAVKRTTDPSQLREFLADYGTSRMGKLARDALQRLATANWRGVNQRDEIALNTFIDAHPGTREIAEASALLTTLQAKQEALASKLPTKGNEGLKGYNGARRPWWIWAAGGTICILVLGTVLYGMSGREGEKRQIAIATPPSASDAASSSVSNAASPPVSNAAAPPVSTPQPPSGALDGWREAMKRNMITDAAPHFFVAPLCPGCDPAGFYCVRPVGSVSDLRGLKVRFAGTDQGLRALLISVGATPVLLPASELYQALKVGVIDCVGGLKLP
jgi:hypothetical protein